MTKILFHLIRADLALFCRGRLALFWTFAFPLLMLVMQMALFGQDVRLGPVTLAILDLDRSQHSQDYIRELTVGLRRQKTLEFTFQPPAAAAKADLTLTIPQGFAANVDAARGTVLELGGTLEAGPSYDAAYGMLRGYSDGYNLNGLRSAPRVSLSAPAARPASLDYRLFLVTGLAGLIILSTSLMGFAAPLVAAREGGMFRMYQLFPMPTSVVVIAWCVSRLFIMLLASLLMFAIAWVLYGIRIEAGFSQLALALAILSLGSAAFLALGLLIAAFTKNVAATTMLCNLLYFPLLFSGNLMIPLGGLPGFLREALDYLPLNAMMDSIRRCLTSGANQHEIYTLLLLTGMLSVCLLLASRKFSWVPRT